MTLSIRLEQTFPVSRPPEVVFDYLTAPSNLADWQTSRPRRVHVHIVEGPYPIDGTWSFEPDGEGTRVHFVAEGELRGVMGVLQPLAKLVMARRMAGYHGNLRRNVEAG